MTDATSADVLAALAPIRAAKPDTAGAALCQGAHVPRDALSEAVDAFSCSDRHVLSVWRAMPGLDLVEEFRA